MDQAQKMIDRLSGFTLVELLTTMAMVAVTLSISAPPLRSLLHKTEVRAQTSRLLNAINLVRSEAIARNIPVSMCPSNSAAGVLPVCGGSYSDGWIVFSNPNRDTVIDPATDYVVARFEGLPKGYSLTNRAGTRAAKDLITYFADGTSRRPRTLLVCSPLGAALTPSSIVMNRVGRPRRASGWGVCP